MLKILRGVMGNRSRTGNKRKKLEQKMAKAAALILSIPDKCIVCETPFDKKDKAMAMTWFVEVYNEEKRVDLYCPKCNEARRENEIPRNTGV